MRNTMFHDIPELDINIPQHESLMPPLELLIFSHVASWQALECLNTAENFFHWTLYQNMINENKDKIYGAVIVAWFIWWS